MDPDQALREARTPRREPRPFQLWTLKRPKQLLSEHSTLPDAQAALEALILQEEKEASEQKRKPRKRLASIWTWPECQELKP